MPKNLEGSEEAAAMDTGGESIPEVTTLDNASANLIQAERVQMNQSSAQQITASQVSLQQGGARHIETEHMNLTQGGAGMVEAASFELKEGGAGVVRCQEATVRDGGVAVLVAESATLQDSQAGVVVTRELRGESLRSVLLIAGRVEAPVETILDTPRAMLAGVASGMAIGLVFLVGRLLTQRSRG